MVGEKCTKNNRAVMDFSSLILSVICTEKPHRSLTKHKNIATNGDPRADDQTREYCENYVK